MNPGIRIAIEKKNRATWLKVNIPYEADTPMTATIQDNGGETLRSMDLETGNNLIDIGSINKQTISIRIDTPFETVLKELNLV